MFTAFSLSLIKKIADLNLNSYNTITVLNAKFKIIAI